MNTSVWTWPYSVKYYLLHPWAWFKELFSNIRAAYRRMKYGQCYIDAWDFARAFELNEERQRLLEDTMTELGKHFFKVWDQEVHMFYSKETAIARIDYRIKIMRARDEMMNLKLIKALEREKRNLETGSN